MTDYEDGEVRYAAQLCGLDLGATITFVHEYVYAGKRKEKILTLRNIAQINYENSSKSVLIWAKKNTDTFNYSWTNVKLDVEVLVTRPNG